MKAFLEYVADDLIGKYGTNMVGTAVVFPNKRASLFLDDYLARRTTQPMWSPAYVTISDLFRRMSDLKVADPLKLVCDLYRVFTQHTGLDDTLDHFFGWGQVLVNDFDDIDKHMADADKVFANLRDIHELDAVDYLTPEQKAVIKKFFANFSDDHNSLLKDRFLRLWSKMGDIYHAYNSLLESQQLTYEGALYRKVVEGLEAATLHSVSYDRYLFVGFNVLSETERRLFLHLKREGRAHFYWDYDRYYMESNEAGHFIAQYLADFPNELDADRDDIFNQFGQPKRVTFVSATTENIQARYCTQWLADQQRAQCGRQTAVVMCNEALLPVVMHSLPESVTRVNITTGYPLSQSPVTAYVKSLINLQTLGYVSSRDEFRLHHVRQVLRHPYTALVSSQGAQLATSLTEQRVYYPTRQALAVDGGLTLLFATPVPNNSALLGWLCQLMKAIACQADDSDVLLQESLFSTYSLLNRLRSLTDAGDLAIDVVTLQRLIMQLLSTATIPLHGEPAVGVQVMGVLETRNLDFDHVLMLSTNEGNMPKGVNDSSFIPFNIRKAYGLTTSDHKVSIYSYHFHRLLQRASDITILYNSATTDGRTGEMSRFMLQLLVEGPHDVALKTLQAGQQLQPAAARAVVKTPAVMQKLIGRFDTDSQPQEKDSAPIITPTALNRYLRCQLMFYYYYVCGLMEPDSTDDDSIDNRVFGNIFHEAACTVYGQLVVGGATVTASQIEQLLRRPDVIERAVDEAIRKELFQASAHYTLNGMQIISREVIIHYLRLLLKQDREQAPFTIVGLECDVVEPVTIMAGSQSFVSRIGGRIDRLDSVMETTADGLKAERLRVLDYKTGSRLPASLASVESVFDPANIARHSDYYLQTMVYACQVSRSPRYNPRSLPVSPALLFIQHAANDTVLSFGKERINSVADYATSFLSQLENLLSEIFNPDVPFTPTADRTRCQNCPYKALCYL